jgi:uncharacterized protein (TIRG00374 family)
VILLVLLGAAVYLVLPQLTKLNNSLQVIRGMALWAVGLAILAQILSYVGSGYLIKTLVAIEGQQLSTRTGIVVTMAASSVALFGTGMVGNAAAIYRWLRTRGISREGALLAGWLPATFNNAVIVLIGVIGIAHLILVHELTVFEAIGFGIALVSLGLTIGLTLWGVYHQKQFTMLLESIARRWSSLRKHPYDPTAAQDTAERIFAAWDALYAGGWKGPALGSILNISFDMLTLYMLFVAAGHTVSMGILLTGYGLPILLSKVPFIPGGVGIVEGTMVLLYNGLGVPTAVTVVVVLAYRTLSFWIPIGLGFPLALYLQRTTPNAGN